ncbi:hypothetical protein C8R44DRAFT_730622 [Mycena epipterygia]|nr:hypothetical protein C8R44DRAFT_730622 [Mycena epipterygia]
MPTLKRKAKAVNLRSYAKVFTQKLHLYLDLHMFFSQKAKLSSGTPTPSPEPSRPASPEEPNVAIDDSESETASQNSQESATPSEDSEDSMLSENLHDVPQFQSEASLLGWLNLGKKKVQKILDRAKEGSSINKKGRGRYYKTQIGAAPSDRTDRLHRADAKKTAKAHGGGLAAWFNKAQVTTEQHESKWGLIRAFPPRRRSIQ